MHAPVRLVLGAVAAAVAVSLTVPASASTCLVAANADVATPVATAHADAWYDAGIHDGEISDSNTSTQVLGLPPLTSGGPVTQSPGKGIVESLTGIWVPGLVCS